MAGFSGATEGGALHGYDVVNNLTSANTDKPLSAAQGKALNDKLPKEIIFTVENTFSLTPNNFGTPSINPTFPQNGHFLSGTVVNSTDNGVKNCIIGFRTSNGLTIWNTTANTVTVNCGDTIKVLYCYI